jgi:DNA end-binding protein Ku
MAPRALWTGSIMFGLVNVPVRLYTAVHEHRLSFSLVHETDDGPIGYEKICKLEGEPVPNDEIVKAYEYEKGEYVHMTDEDFDAVQVEGVHTMELEDFVSYDEIDPVYFAHSYLVGPQDGAEKTYALLVRAMEASGLAGIGRFVMRNRQYLGCLRVRDGVLSLEQMHFADEIDDPGKLVPDKLPSVAKRELDMALTLIDGFSGSWKPEKYRDTYTDALMKVVEAKVKGHEIHVAPAQEEEAPPDLMEALRRSIEAHDKRPRAPRARQTEADEPTKAELEEQARELDIPGRSKMTKDELAEAIEAAS